MRFRKLVIGFFSGGGQQSPQDQYCQMCRQLGEDDCDNCSKQIEVIDG